MKAYTKEKLTKLREKHQRVLTLDDVEAIVELDAIACRIEKSVKEISERDWFEIDGHFFHKPTFAREQLIQRISAKYGNGPLQAAGILYALDMDTNSSELDKTPSYFKLLAYIATLDINIRKAILKLEELFCKDDDDEPSGGGGPRLSEWHLCALLAREIGGSPDEWYNSSPEKIQSACKVIDEKIAAEAKALGGRVSGPPRETPKLIAIKEFRDKLNELEARWLAKAE